MDEVHCRAEAAACLARREQPALQGFEVAADLGVGPVGGADEFAADDAIAIDDIGFRPHVGVEEACGGLAGVADRNEIDVAIPDEGRVGVGVFVDGDGEDDEVGIVVVELEKRGQFCHAGSAPGGPEVEQDNLASIAGEMDRVGAVRDREVGCGLSGLCGMCATVAAGGEGQRESK